MGSWRKEYHDLDHRVRKNTHGRKHNPRRNPCERPPGRPTHHGEAGPMDFKLVMTAEEAKTHLEFMAYAKWNEQTVDVDGIDLEKNRIDRYQVQMRQTKDAAGNVPAVDDDGKPVLIEKDRDVKDDNDTDDTYRMQLGHLAHPKYWYVSARIRVRAGKGCWSQWSTWTTPETPWEGANPKPPVPEGVDLDWDKQEKHRFNRYIGVALWNEVTDFDYPGTPADDEEDVSRYAIRVQASKDGETPVGRTRHYVREAKDQDADELAQFRFHRVNRRYFYRISVRCIDRFNRRGDWSDWTPWSKPGADTPPYPLNVKIKEGMKDSVVLVVESPVEPGETDVPNEEIEHYRFEISTSQTFATTYDVASVNCRDMKERKAFHIPAEDRDLVFYGRARSVSSDHERSGWVPATKNGNSNPGATAEGIELVRDRVIAEFTKNGAVEQKHYRQLWTADRRYKFKKVRARVGKHVPADHPGADGCPTGGALIIQVFHHNSDESVETKLFAADDRLTISAGTHKDSSWASNLTKLYIDEDEHLSVKVPQVGSTNPGEDLVVQVVMVPEGTSSSEPVYVVPFGTATIPTPTVVATAP